MVAVRQAVIFVILLPPGGRSFRPALGWVAKLVDAMKIPTYCLGTRTVECQCG